MDQEHTLCYFTQKNIKYESANFVLSIKGYYVLENPNLKLPPGAEKIRVSGVRRSLLSALLE
jgi:hypothetical protein